MELKEAEKLFKNESGLEFTFVNEDYRKYIFANGSSLDIRNVLFLHVSESGGHRIFTESGRCFYVNPKEGWYIEWIRADEETPHFSK